METRKIALACALGGATCAGLALLLTPAYWYLGIVAGLIAGYFGYEFRQACRAMPGAIRQGFQGLGIGSSWLCEQLAERFRRDVRWLRELHPFLYTCVPVTLLVLALIHARTGCLGAAVIREIGLGQYCGFAVMYVIGGGIEITGILVILTYFLAYTGSRFGTKSYFFRSDDDEKFRERFRKSEEVKGLREEEATYANVQKWIWLGALISLRFIAWDAPKFLMLGWFLLLKTAVLGTARSAFFLFKAIHSNRRVLCAMDGTLGGAIAYIRLSPTLHSFAGHLAVVAFGALIGAFIGILNWELVSVRILRLVPRTD